MTLEEFLVARLDEDEAEAQTAGADAMVGFRWKQYPEPAYNEIQAMVLANSRRVLAEVDAKRRIVEIHSEGHECPTGSEYPDTGWYGGIEPCPTLQLLAEPYAGNPDYREEWRP